MKSEDKKKFYTIIVQTADVYGKKLTKEQLRMYFSALAGLTIDEFERAAGVLLATSKYMPVPADFYEAAGKNLKPTGKNWKIQAELWWSMIVHTMERHGSGRSVSFDDPAVNDWIRTVGGWPYLCQKSYNDLGFAKRAFVEYYVSAKGTGFTKGTEMLKGEFEGEPILKVSLEPKINREQITHGTPENLEALEFSPTLPTNESSDTNMPSELS